MGVEIMARRKRLLSLDKLEEGNKLLDLGVPMTKVHLKLGLDAYWSCQSTADIFMADRADLYSVTRPDWLQKSNDKEDEFVPMIQDTPKGWRFEGIFPYGEWLKSIVAEG